MTVESPKILHFDTLPSTNSYALDNLQRLEDCTVISAEVQTAGKGRLGRKWVSNTPNNLYLSIILKNIINPEVFGTFPLYTALCTCNTLQLYNVMPKIKWPNDILVNNSKIAGILCETKSSANGCIVIGIGINLNQEIGCLQQIDQPATSLNIILQKFIEPSLFQKALLDIFFGSLPAYKAKGFAQFNDDFLAFLLPKLIDR